MQRFSNALAIATVFGTLAVTGAASPPARAGVELVHEVILPNPVTYQPLKQEVKTWQEGRRLRRETPMTRETVIVDLDAHEVTGISDEKRTFWKLPSDKYQRLALASLAVMGVQVQADGQAVVPDPLFSATGATAEIAGHPAVEYKIVGPLPQGVSTSVWIATDTGLKIDQLVDQMRLSLGDPKGAGFESLFRQWKGLKGYPVQNVTTVRTAKMEIITSETLLKVTQKKIPKSFFEVPAGYALVTDPVTLLEEQMAKQQAAPVGIGAPLKPQAH